MAAASSTPAPSTLASPLGQIGLTAVLVGTLASAALPAASPLAQGLVWLSGGGLVLYVLLTLPLLGGKSRVFMVLSAIMAAATLLLPDSAQQMADAFRRAGFVSTLYVALGFLRDASETSPMVRRCGRFLADQRPGWRYIALTAGGHVFGLIVNFGVIPLLGAMVVSATQGDDSPRGRLRRRRMLTAVHRGFCGILCWSPLTVSLAVVMASLPSLTWERAAPWLLGSAFIVLALGWAFDRAIRPTRPPGAPPPPRPEGSWWLTLPIIGMVALVFASGALWQGLSGVSLAIGVMTATPFVAFGWWMAQALPAPPLAVMTTATRRTAVHIRDAFPRYGNEVTLLASAAFIGSVIGAFIPGEPVAAALHALPLPPWALAAVVMWLTVAMGQAGMNPVLSVTILAAALPAPESLHLAPEVLAVALTGGWTLTAGTSPFSAAPLVTGQLAGVSAAVVGRRWNGWWAIACLCALTGWIAVVDLLTR